MRPIPRFMAGQANQAQIILIHSLAVAVLGVAMLEFTECEEYMKTNLVLYAEGKAHTNDTTPGFVDWAFYVEGEKQIEEIFEVRILDHEQYGAWQDLNDSIFCIDANLSFIVQVRAKSQVGKSPSADYLVWEHVIPIE